jgi:hypothetical protein
MQRAARGPIGDAGVVEGRARARPEASERTTRSVGPPARTGRSRQGAALELQRAAGNRAVASVLQSAVVQRDADADESTYLKRLTDAATAAELGDLPGFDPKKVGHAKLNTKNEGTAEPGLNLSLATGARAAQTGWVDDAGKYPVKLALNHSQGVPKVHTTMIISASALTGDKSLSIATIRHEMVHARHHQMTLELLKQWDGEGGRRGFERFLNNNQKRLRLSGLDRVLVDEQADDLGFRSEVLGYVMGFRNRYHLATVVLRDEKGDPARTDPPKNDESAVVLAELLGAVHSKYDNWDNAKGPVQDEAMAQLRTYYETLDMLHQRRWKQWVESIKNGTGPGLKDFHDRLAAFVK